MKARLLAATALSVALAGEAFALPAVGGALPNARVVDADGKGLELSGLRGRPLLLVYENKEATKQNATLKADLAKRASGDKYKKAIALLAVADVDGYDYWPARGFVKSAIRSESSKLGHTIFIDWDGSMRKRVGLTEGKSAVLLVGRDGKILFSHEGSLDAKKRATLLALLEEQVEPKPTAKPAPTPTTPSPTTPTPTTPSPTTPSPTTPSATGKPSP